MFDTNIMIYIVVKSKLLILSILNIHKKNKAKLDKIPTKLYIGFNWSKVLPVKTIIKKDNKNKKELGKL